VSPIAEGVDAEPCRKSVAMQSLPAVGHVVLTRKSALTARLDAIHRHCPHDAVVVLLDGDDVLSDEGVFEALDREYQAGADAVWTQYKTPDGHKGISHYYSGDPLTCRWRMSHLKTFRKRLIWGVRPETFIDPQTGKHWAEATDQAIYRPVLALAKDKRFLDRVCVVYTDDVSEAKAEKRIATAARLKKRLLATMMVVPKKVAFFVNGPCHSPDERLWMGERRAALGVLSMCAHLQTRGHDVRLYDRFVAPYVWPEQYDFEVACVYASTPNCKDAAWIVRRLENEWGEGPIFLGGPHAARHPGAVNEWPIDHAADYEADFAISALVEGDAERLPESARRIRDLDSLPFPAYSIPVPYVKTWPFGGHSAVCTLNTSRGCVHECAFCETPVIWGRHRYAQSEDRIRLDVDHLIEHFGADAIYFREDNFRGLTKPIPVPWACEVRADVACNPGWLAKQAEYGCLGIYMGAESGSDEQLKRMKKGITRAQIILAVEEARHAGVQVALSFVDGFPGETEEDREKTDSLIAWAGAKHVWRNKYRRF
jgi:hypothetical protein